MGRHGCIQFIKPALAGHIALHWRDHAKEYKKYIEKDAALERRFQQVLVEEQRLKMQFQYYAASRIAMSFIMAFASKIKH